MEKVEAGYDRIAERYLREVDFAIEFAQKLTSHGATWLWVLARK